MRVRVITYVDVDPEKWAEQNGVERKDVRKDVDRYVSNSVRELPAVKDAEPDE